MTTPTNEAGHGLPELPVTFHDDFKGDDAKLIESAKALISLSDSGSMAPHGIGGHARTILSAFIVRTESALALSRGVPEGDCRPKCTPIDFFNGEACEYCIGEHFSPKAAPAAAGAQGEVPNVADVLMKTDDPIQQIRMVVQVARENDSLISRKWVEGWADQWERERRLTTPQPAAADGGVRELPTMTPERCAFFLSRFKSDEKMLGPNEQLALDYAIAALSSHRQAGDDLSKFRELAERWLAEDARRHSAPTELSGCADDLLALVEKGAGNG